MEEIEKHRIFQQLWHSIIRGTWRIWGVVIEGTTPVYCQLEGMRKMPTSMWSHRIGFWSRIVIESDAMPIEHYTCRDIWHVWPNAQLLYIHNWWAMSSNILSDMWACYKMYSFRTDSGFGGGRGCGKRSLRWRLGLTWVADDQGFIRKYYFRRWDGLWSWDGCREIVFFTPGGGRLRGNDGFRSISGEVRRLESEQSTSHIRKLQCWWRIHRDKIWQGEEFVLASRGKRCSGECIKPRVDMVLGENMRQWWWWWWSLGCRLQGMDKKDGTMMEVGMKEDWWYFNLNKKDRAQDRQGLSGCDDIREVRENSTRQRKWASVRSSVVIVLFWIWNRIRW